MHDQELGWNRPFHRHSTPRWLRLLHGKCSLYLLLALGGKPWRAVHSGGSTHYARNHLFLPLQWQRGFDALQLSAGCLHRSWTNQAWHESPVLEWTPENGILLWIQSIHLEASQGSLQWREWLLYIQDGLALSVDKQWHRTPQLQVLLRDDHLHNALSRYAGTLYVYDFRELAQCRWYEIDYESPVVPIRIHWVNHRICWRLPFRILLLRIATGDYQLHRWQLEFCRLGEEIIWQVTRFLR